MTKKRPYFSILLPVFKTEEYLEDCINSLLKQTFTDFEAIFIDDKSPKRDGLDHSKDIISKLTNNDERFIHIQNEVNLGRGKTRNRGLDAATGKRLVFLDSDDYFETDYLQKAFDSIKDEKVIHFGGVKHLTDKGIESMYKYLKYIPFPNNLKTMLVFPTWTFTPVNYFWELDLVKKYKIKYKLTSPGEDTAFVIDNILAHQKEYKSLKFKFIPIYYIYRHVKQHKKRLKSEYEIRLFSEFIHIFTTRRFDINKCGSIYEFLNNLNLLRLGLYIKRVKTKNSILKLGYTALVKPLTLFTTLVSGSRKLKTEYINKIK